MAKRFKRKKPPGRACIASPIAHSVRHDYATHELVEGDYFAYAPQFYDARHYERGVGRTATLTEDLWQVVDASNYAYVRAQRIGLVPNMASPTGFRVYTAHAKDDDPLIYAHTFNREDCLPVLVELDNDKGYERAGDWESTCEQNRLDNSIDFWTKEKKQHDRKIDTPQRAVKPTPMVCHKCWDCPLKARERTHEGCRRAHDEQADARLLYVIH